MVHEYIDLTQTIFDKMPVLPGDMEVILEQSNHINPHGYTNFQLHTGMHTGTHIDGPYHMSLKGATIDSVPVTNFIGKGILIDLKNDNKSYTIPELEDFSIVIIITGHSKYFGTDHYFTSYPEIPVSLIRELIKSNIKMIGIDSPSPDYEPYSVHKLLFDSGIFIIENLTNLQLLSGKKGFEIIALPLKIRADSSPARVIAKIDNA